jgi:hypothetical protein
MTRHYAKVFILLFLGLLIVPLRTLALDPYAIEDSFYPRARLVTWTSNLRLLIGDRVYPKVIVGDDGWLVYTAEGDVEDYQKTESFSGEELRRIQQGLDTLSARYAEEGILLIVVIPPNKNTIYPERVPSEIPVLGEVSKLDQLIDYLRVNGEQQILDLRAPLLTAKAERQIYYATDTHWNDYGAYIAYSVILQELQKTYPNLSAYPISRFNVSVTEPDQLDLSRNIGMTLLPESRVQFAPLFDLSTSYKELNLGGRKMLLSYNADETLPDLILYHDSFFFSVIPFLGEHFHHGLFIQNYTGGGLWNLSWVDEQKPDVVIIEFTERYLSDLPRFLER